MLRVRFSFEKTSATANTTPNTTASLSGRLRRARGSRSGMASGRSRIAKRPHYTSAHGVVGDAGVAAPAERAPLAGAATRRAAVRRARVLRLGALAGTVDREGG